MNAERPALGIALAIIQLVDGVLCATLISERFTAYLDGELERLRISSLTQQAMPLVKVAAAIGLLVGLWVPLLGAASAAALIAYFVIAIGAHARVKDPPAKYVNASVMLAFTGVVLALTYLAAL